MIKKEIFKLKDLFNIERGKSIYTKKFGNTHKGEHPVYSASNNTPLTHINTFDFNGNFLTWATNGFAGYVKLIDGKFSINADRGLLIPKKKDIDLIYIKNIIEPQFRALAKGRKGERGEDEFTKVYPSMIENIEIVMPVKENGNFDINIQKLVVKKILSIQEIKRRLEDYKKQIEEICVEILPEGKIMEVSVIDKSYFNLLRGKRITREIIDKNKGQIPVYSSSKDEKSKLGYISEIYLKKNNLTLIQEPSILFNLDGSVGYCFIRNDTKYSFIDVVASLIPKDKNLDLEFILYKLREEIIKTGANYQSKLYFNKIKGYDIKLPIPIKENGAFDLMAQKQIADKYKKIEEIKINLISELDKIINISIDFE